MKLYKILFIVAIAFAVNSCNQKPAKTEADSHVQYYRNIQFSETPWDIEKGTHPLTAEEAKTINNYKFSTNENGQLVSVEYNRNDTLLNYSSIGAAKITYTYEGDKQLKHFFDDKNKSTKNGGVSTFEYTLDESGMRIAMRFLDENNAPVENRNKVHNFEWNRLDNGMIREIRFNLAGDNVVMNPFCPFYELRFSYDENGFVTRMANYEADTLYNCTAENCGDIGVSYFLFENNANGDLESFSVHNTVGQLSNLYWGWAKRVNVVDENGYVLETTQFDQDNEYLGGKNVPVTRLEYDEHGALVKQVSMDKDKNIVNNPGSGVAKVVYKYDENGRRIETLQYDKDDVLVEKKA
ncbi:MAG TPA: hypothetical protein VFC65_15825 [Prolixibacteraceae bacterium]|nr:hypothetical protein [Prolixibacteraceae bacterium]